MYSIMERLHVLVNTRVNWFHDSYVRNLPMERPVERDADHNYDQL